MAITNIHVSNFKSFNELDVKLGKINVLIGANASGKSNFVQIFKFLREIVNYGLNNAISLQGGVEYLRNFSVKDTNNLSIKINSNYINGIILLFEQLRRTEGELSEWEIK